MGLDVGDKRIGIALSDPLGITAQGHSVLERKTKKSDFQTINELCRQYNIETIVIGMPLNMNGTRGPRTVIIEEFARELAQFCGKKTEFWDERLSTVSAEKVLLEADLSRKKRKGLRDKIAAVYILQGYLDRQAHGFQDYLTEDPGKD